MSAMGLKIYAGKTFHLRKSTVDKPHLWIAVTDPDVEQKIAIVNLTTLRHDSDTTVTLDSIDHPFIKHKTIVFYADALVTKVIAIQNAINNGLSRFDEDCSEPLLERIQLGLLESPFTPKNIKKYCRECFNDF